MKGLFLTPWARKCRSLISFFLVSIITTSFSITPTTSYAQSMLTLPAPGQMVGMSRSFVPVMLRAVTVHPDQPLVFDFIMDSGNTSASQEEIKKETEKMAKYFLASLTIPEKDLWVNLSPYENNRVITDSFGQTEMGRDLLAQDYILKQLSASLVYPEKELGKEFWARVYERVHSQTGSRDLPADTFNKIWVTPDRAVVYEQGNTAVVGEAHLKVMIESDYLARTHAQAVSGDATQELAKKAIRDIVIPAIEKEVNEGENFAPLRQVYQALILATWYKKALKESLLGQVYADRNKLAGVDTADKADTARIYARYIEAYRKGVFNYIKEEADSVTQEVLPRKYFSGGVTFEDMAQGVEVQRSAVPLAAARPVGAVSRVTLAMARPASVLDMAQADNAQNPDEDMPEENPGLKDKSFVHFIHPQGDPDATENFTMGEGASLTRVIKFDFGIQLISTYDQHSDMTEHRAVGPTIPRMVMVRKGNETKRDWRDIFVYLEDGVDPVTGIPYRDGIVAGNAYSAFMEQAEVNQVISSYGQPVNAATGDLKTAFARVKREFRPDDATKRSSVAAIKTVDSGDKVTFGIAMVTEGDGKRVIVAETGWVKMVQEKGDPFFMLERSIAYLLNQGTDGQNRVAEYRYARKRLLDDGGRSLNDEVFGHPETVVKKLIAEIDGPPRELVVREWKRKVVELVYGRAIKGMNGEAGNKAARFRWGPDDPEYASGENVGTAKVGVYASAFNPFHAGQMEGVLRAMYYLGIDQVGFVIHAFDTRKMGTGLNPTFSERDEMTNDLLVDIFGENGLLRTARIANGSQLDGESKVKALIELNKDRPQEVVIVYVGLGSDHGHLYAPSAWRTGLILGHHVRARGLDWDELTRLLITNNFVSDKDAHNKGQQVQEGVFLADDIGVVSADKFPSAGPVTWAKISVFLLSRGMAHQVGPERIVFHVSPADVRFPGILGEEFDQDEVAFILPVLKDSFKMNELVKVLKGTSFQKDIWKVLEIMAQSLAERRRGARFAANTTQVEADTLTKLIKELELKGNIKLVVVAGNNRELPDGLPLFEEWDEFTRILDGGKYVVVKGANLFGTSSTEIRKLAEGDARAKDYHLFKSLRRRIARDARYRAFMIGLPLKIKTAAKEILNDGVPSSPAAAEALLKVQQWIQAQRRAGAEGNPNLADLTEPQLAEWMARRLSFSLQQLEDMATYFTFGALEATERAYGGQLRNDVIEVTVEEVGAVLDYLRNTGGHMGWQTEGTVSADLAQALSDVGGIDFDPAGLNLTVERTGQGIQVKVDPAEIERIRTEGIDGFAPVIINIMPVQGIIPLVGLESEGPSFKG
jgi:nicotinic acid mononucleotide adenylyltransferase